MLKGWKVKRWEGWKCGKVLVKGIAVQLNITTIQPRINGQRS